MMFAIVDCNNFYVSCERVFNPKLIGKAIVVLSNNDGCVIARSNEAKAMGIRMGQPFFELNALCAKKQVIALSSNYALYGDMSQRVMSIIEANWPESEVYSIDEAFLELKQLTPTQALKFSDELQKKVLQYTGIPVSIGLGATKTLAKLANYIAKKKLERPVYDISENLAWLDSIPVSEIWGVGRKLASKLNALGILTAQNLADASPTKMRKKFSVLIMQTVQELNGLSSLSLNEVSPKKSIACAKSFGQLQTEYQPISNALANYCARAAEKLRRQESRAGVLSVYLRTNPYIKTLPQYSKAIEIIFMHPTNDTRVITTQALSALEKLYRKGFHYKKVGVCLSEITPASCFQNDLFFNGEQALVQSDKVMLTLDSINQKFGKGTLRTASEGYTQTWCAKRVHCSPCYTTRWADLPIVV